MFCKNETSVGAMLATLCEWDWHETEIPGGKHWPTHTSEGMFRFVGMQPCVRFGTCAKRKIQGVSVGQHTSANMCFQTH